MLGRAGIPPLLAGLESRDRVFRLPPVRSTRGQQQVRGPYDTSVHSLRAGSYADHYAFLRSFSVITAFSCFGVITVVCRLASPILRQDHWPAVANVIVNIALVAGSFDVGFRVDRYLFLLGLFCLTS